MERSTTPATGPSHRRESSLPTLVALLLLAIPCAAMGEPPSADERTPAATGSWPDFRGARRDGVSDETGLASTWPESGPPVVWRRSLGAGFSGIAVDGERAFTLEQADGVQRVVALDARDGSLLWTRTTGPAFTHEYGDGPRATPVVDGDRVFVVDADARVGALDVETGDVLWGHDLAAAFGARPPAIGFSSTPLLVDGRLIVEAGAADGAFMAFDTETGQLRWSSGSDEAAYVSPIVVDVLGRRQVIFFSGSGLHAVDPENGAPLWHRAWTSPCPATGIPLQAASPVFLPPDRLFAAVAWGEQSGGGVLRIVEGDDGLATEPVWFDPQSIDGELSTPVRVGGHLYGFKGGRLLAVDAESGEVAWSLHGFGRGSLIAADGRLIVLAEHGALALLEATPDEARRVSETQLLDGRSWTSPSLAGGRLYVRNETEMVSVDLRGGPATETAPSR